MEKLTGLDFIKAYRANPEKFLPFMDRTCQTPARNEYGEVNIGWNAGLLKDGRPYFVECWAVDHITMLTFYFAVKETGKETPEEIKNVLLDSGYFKYKDYDQGLPEVNTFGIPGESEFYSIGITVGVDEEPEMIEGAPIIPWSVLNEYNMETMLRDDEPKGEEMDLDTSAEEEADAIVQNTTGREKRMLELKLKAQSAWNEEELDLLVQLGNALEEGFVFEQDYEMAYELYSAAVDARDDRALNSLGWLTQNGLGTEKDVETARYLYLAAAMRGNTTAMVNLGNGYEQGLFDGEPNYRKAVKWYWKAASEKDPDGLFNFANCYHHGWGVEQNHEKAFEIFKAMADRGYTQAAFYVGLYYQEGLAGEQNYELAREYYEQGARDDDMYCYNQLGTLYGQGLGVEKDKQLSATEERQN